MIFEIYTVIMLNAVSLIINFKRYSGYRYLVVKEQQICYLFLSTEIALGKFHLNLVSVNTILVCSNIHFLTDLSTNSFFEIKHFDIIS